MCSGIGAGVPLAGIVIESAGDIDINTPLYPVIGGNTYLNNDGFNVGSFIVEGNGQTCASATCVAGATGSLNAGGSYVSTYRSDGAAGNITIDVGGNVEVGYQVYADPSGSGKGGNGGNVTIVAGGTVQVGDQLGVGPAVSCFVACSTPGAIRMRALIVFPPSAIPRSIPATPRATAATSSFRVRYQSAERRSDGGRCRNSERQHPERRQRR